MDNAQQNFVDTNWPPTRAWEKKNGITYHLRDRHVTPMQRRKAYHKKVINRRILTQSNQTLTSTVQANAQQKTIF
jgi:hypothetical protein